MLHIINHSRDNTMRNPDEPSSIPTLHLYLLDSDNPRPCILILPGGGYHHLADHEGEPVARWLNTLGIHAAVLEYSTYLSLTAADRIDGIAPTSSGHTPAMPSSAAAFSEKDSITTPSRSPVDLSVNKDQTSTDARQATASSASLLIDPSERLQETEEALRLLRQYADEWTILPQQIGLIGFSAGGHLAALTATIGHIRPDLLLLAYPVITFHEPYTHSGSRLHFLGASPEPQAIEQYSAEQQVSESTPPTFIWTTADDASVPAVNSLLFSQALVAHHIPHELHLMESGRHGLGLALEHPYCRQWTELAASWLGRHGYGQQARTLSDMPSDVPADSPQPNVAASSQADNVPVRPNQVLSGKIATTSTSRPTLFIAGDSTAAIKGASEKPMSGWGEYLQPYFGEAVTVANHAINGRSTRSFLAEGRLQHLSSKLQPGDYVLIQFGHNDQKADDPARYTDPDTDYRSYLQQFIDMIKQRGAAPVLLTPVSRRRFLPNGIPDPQAVGRYPQAMRQTAAALDIPLLDIFAASQQLYATLGEVDSRELFMHILSGQHPNYPDGIADDTHFSVQGAQAIAELVISAILQHPGLTALHSCIRHSPVHTV
ncbi:GDSL-type esterase/lipase family protein [Paenibacillus bovis]|uniref:Esterase n=1 Tax=Paenibacillus bovis TaxID=1616788 RepID=A0A172ZFA3_9BACL|nr:GDSL-type esterase/lipase family protein [Paenibacillus bovis]ANF96315.1 esterase [Paenibacillus bovis]